MANFQTHITVSSLFGVGYGAAAYVGFDLPLPTCMLAGGLCSVSGMLPDLDSGPGVPLRESMAFAAAVVPMFLVHHLRRMGLPHESIILAAAGLYLLIRFGLTELLKLYTVHRGMFHSIPAVLIAGQLAFLASSGDTVWLRLYTAGAVSLGYLSHLVLDEIWALKWHRGRLQMKSSFGTALKLFGHGWWSNVSAFGKLALLSFVVLRQPDVTSLLRPQDSALAGQKTTEMDRVVGDKNAAPLTNIR